MSWQKLLANGSVKKHQTSKDELDSLRAVVERDLKDAALDKLSDDRRFATAYNAILQLSKMVIACAGYRVSGHGHHQVSFEVLELAMDKGVANMAAYFDSCRKKRNALDYDTTRVVSAKEVAEIISKAQEFRLEVEKWISAKNL